MSKLTPGEETLEIGVIHLDASNRSCVAELRRGMVNKHGEVIVTSTQHAHINWSTVEALFLRVRDTIQIDLATSQLAGVEIYERPIPAAPEPPPVPEPAPLPEPEVEAEPEAPAIVEAEPEPVVDVSEAPPEAAEASTEGLPGEAEAPPSES